MLLEPQNDRSGVQVPKFNILVLCTGNSARSIIAEALFKSEGASYFNAFSAGSNPTGRINPFALEQISRLNADIELRSKSWREFEGEHAPHLDFVMTVCGNAAQETCPRFSGRPFHIHWGLPDPAAATGSGEDVRGAFAACFKLLQSRIRHLIRQMNTEMNSEMDILKAGKLMRALATDHASNHYERQASGETS